ncbi:hypothetical protein AB0F77_31825 [Streptomyces sp. NPDC026672]|uniref:hypothetical protein n=1 Tax=unclassified Streptomyces TaxID=2593676 RepID=UPI0033F83F30
MLATVALALSGCSAHAGKDSPAQGHGPGQTASGGATPSSHTKAAPTRPPRTAVQFVARARQSLRGEKGWTFALIGSESVTLRGQAPTSATYGGTVHRTTGTRALEQTGTTTTGKGERKRELVYVVGGTGYVKRGVAAWKRGPLSDTGIADTVEDPVADLDDFAAYARSAEVSRTGGGVRLRVTASGWQLSAARTRPALRRAVREAQPTLTQLRAAGVTATEARITLRSFTETWDLDAAHGYRPTAHRYAFTFLVPFQGGDITMSQELRATNRGVFTGTVTLPAAAR